MAHVVHGSAGVQTKGYPAVGDTVDYETNTGYRLVQHRPRECREMRWLEDKGRYGTGCQCGTCDGVTTKHTEKVARVVPYMDNSTEVFTESGKMLMWEYPHGDACF